MFYVRIEAREPGESQHHQGLAAKVPKAPRSSLTQTSYCLRGPAFVFFSAEVSGGVVPHRSQNGSYAGPARMRSCPGNRALVRERLHTPNGSPSPVFAAPPRRFVASCFSALAGASLPRLPLSVAQVRGSPRLSGRVAQRGRIGGAGSIPGPAVAGRLRARRGSFGRRRRGRGPACIEVV